MLPSESHQTHPISPSVAVSLCCIATPSHRLQTRPRVDPERHLALHCQGTLPPSHHGRTDRPAIHDGRRQAAVGREAESSSTLVVQMDSHKCGCRWNIGSCGHNQTFFSQIPTATLRHHVQHLAQKTRHLFNFPVHQTAPKTMLWRPQTNASNGQLPPRGRGTRGGEYIYIYG